MTNKEKSDKDVYYEEVLSTAALALSNSKDCKDRDGRMKIMDQHHHQSYNQHHHHHQRYNQHQSHNDGNINIINGGNNMSLSLSLGAKAKENGDADADTDTELTLLSSLPQRPIANFPSESDRKRVIGMLATIISMTYQYEDSEIMDYSPIEHEQEQDQDQEYKGEGEDYYDNNDDDSYGNDFDGNGNMNMGEIKSIQESSDQIVADDLFDDLWERTSPIKGEEENNSNANANANGDAESELSSQSQLQLPQLQSQNRGRNKSSPSGGKEKDKMRNSKKLVADSPSASTSGSTTTTSNSNSNSTSSASKKSSTPTRSQSKAQVKEDTVARKRYKRRRHKVYSEFFVLTADLLFLDKSNAIAFLPLLNSLLGTGYGTGTGAGGFSNGVEEGFNIVKKMTPLKKTPKRRGDGANAGNDDGDYERSNRDTTGADDETDNGTDNENGRLNYKNEADHFLLREWKSSTNNHNLHHNGTQYENNNGSNPNSNSQAQQQHQDQQQQQQPWDNNDILQPFVESLEPGAGFQCLSLLLMNYLLQSEQGYDARIRACIKKLGVIIFTHELKQSDCDEIEQRQRLNTNMGKSVEDCFAVMATRKFESLEHLIAMKLLRISAAQQQEKAAQDAAEKDKKSRGSTRAKIMRGLKIGTAGVAAGTLLAVTGGLAAPGIAAGLAATGITTAATAGVVTTLTSTAAMTTIFGVGGGGLAAYKTHRRTKGVTEFTFQKQGIQKRGQKQRGNSNSAKEDETIELFSTICISGWLKDDKDFERPWGVEPSNPPITDRIEKLSRFYAIHKPSNIGRCQQILDRWKGEERELWAVLKQKYGQDPDHLYPMVDSAHRRICLTHEEDEILDNLLGELGYSVPVGQERDRERDDSFHATKENMLHSDSMDACSISALNASMSNTSSDLECEQNQQGQSKTKKFELSLWDYQIEYGGELLTVRWESDMLVELCDSVSDMAADMVGQAAREVLKQTALATLITAIALPYAIVRAADMIDGIWTLAIERADLAGIELANTLLESEAGHRPVVLVGFSMGARTIYSCLKELARQQERWEEYQEDIAIEKASRKKGIRQGIGKQKGKSKPKLHFSREPASIIEDAIVMGLPNHLSLSSWESCRRIVAGRFVNCYSKNDMILSLMFQIKRLSGALRKVCGTSPVAVQGVENYNVSSLIKAHSDYCTATSHILRMVYHGCPHRASSTIVIPSEAAKDDV